MSNRQQGRFGRHTRTTRQGASERAPRILFSLARRAGCGRAVRHVRTPHFLERLASLVDPSGSPISLTGAIRPRIFTCVPAGPWFIRFIGLGGRAVALVRVEHHSGSNPYLDPHSLATPIGPASSRHYSVLDSGRGRSGTRKWKTPSRRHDFLRFAPCRVQQPARLNEASDAFVVASCVARGSRASRPSALCPRAAARLVESSDPRETRSRRVNHARKRSSHSRGGKARPPFAAFNRLYR
jgi:hypothetical protein